MKLGLVLEGGGMRGVYTAGILDFFMDKEILVNYVIGVSAGACNGMSYVSGQRGRAYRTNTEFITDKRYLSIGNLLRTGSIFGMDFLFDDLPNHLLPFDYDSFYQSPCQFVIGVTNVITGRPEYYDKPNIDRDNTLLRASSSIPVFAPIVEYRNNKYLDGGTSDAIPVKKALEDGCDKVIIVLTRDRNYRKTPEKFRRIYRKIYKAYPKMIETLDQRHLNYNKTLDYIKELEQEEKALVLAPSHPLPIGRFEKNVKRLQAVWQSGYQDGKNRYQKLLHFMERSQSEESV